MQIILHNALYMYIFCCHSDPKVVYRFGGGEGAIFLNDIQCLGNETNLLQCTYNGFEVDDCAHYEDAGVSCGNFSLLWY